MVGPFLLFVKRMFATQVGEKPCGLTHMSGTYVNMLYTDAFYNTLGTPNK